MTKPADTDVVLQPIRNPYGNVGQTLHDPWTVDYVQTLAEYAPVFPLTSYFMGKSKEFLQGDVALNWTDRQRWLPVQQQSASLNEGALSGAAASGTAAQDQEIQQLVAPIVIDKSYNTVIKIDAQQIANTQAYEGAIKSYMNRLSWQIEESIHKEIQAKATMTRTSSKEMDITDLEKIQYRFNQNGLYGKKMVAFYAPCDYSSLIEVLSRKEYDSSRTTDAIERYRVPNLLANMESFEQGSGVLLPKYNIDVTLFTDNPNNPSSLKDEAVIKLYPDVISNDVSEYGSKRHAPNNTWIQFPSTYKNPGDINSGYRDNRSAKVAFTYKGALVRYGVNSATSDPLVIRAGTRFTIGSTAKSVDGFTKQASRNDMQFTISEDYTPTSNQATSSGVSNTQWINISPAPINGTVVPAGKDLVGVGLPSAYQTYTGQPSEEVKNEDGNGVTFLNTKSQTPSYFLTPDSVMVVSAEQEMQGNAGWDISIGYTPSGFPVTIMKQEDADAMKYRIKLLCNFGVSMLNPQEGLVFLSQQDADSDSNAG